MLTRQQQLQGKDVFISCIVPVHNEAAGISLFIEALKTALQSLTNRFEIILIDDGSQDESQKVITETLVNKEVKLIAFSRNFGKESALTAGLLYCQGDVAILIDADFQHPLEILPVFLEKWAEGYDMPYGLRNSRDNESRIKRWFTHQFYRLMGHVSEVPLPPDAGDFRLLDRRVIDALNNCHENNRFMKGLYAWVGFNAIAVPYDVQERLAGTSSWSFTKLFNLALTGLISFSDAPLRVWSLIGSFISGIAFIYAIWIIVKTLVFGVDTPGYATIIVAIMFFGGVQLISVGILGEYIARIFREVKKRPSFIVSKTIGFEQDL